MGCGIDTAGKTRGDDETFDSEVCGEAPGEFLSLGRAVAGAHDGHDWDVGEIELALGVEERRGRVDLRQRRRVAWLSDGDEVRL
jgi:hypothetical protein